MCGINGYFSPTKKYNSSHIKEHWLGFYGLPVTIYQLLKNPIDILNIGTIMGNGHENYNIKEGDFVLFFYGWNDIQKNIYKYHKENFEIEIGVICSISFVVAFILLVEDFKWLI